MSLTETFNRRMSEILTAEPATASTPSDLAVASIEARLKRVELKLGLREPDPVPEAVSAFCLRARIHLPLELFPGRNGKAISMLWTAFDLAPEREQATMVHPRTIEQDVFDRHFDLTDLTVKGIRRELKRFAANGWGSQPILQMRSHPAAGTPGFAL